MLREWKGWRGFGGVLSDTAHVLCVRAWYSQAKDCRQPGYRLYSEHGISLVTQLLSRAGQQIEKLCIQGGILQYGVIMFHKVSVSNSL